jgi:hypothetical protein
VTVAAPQVAVIIATEPPLTETLEPTSTPALTDTPQGVANADAHLVADSDQPDRSDSGG